MKVRDAIKIVLLAAGAVVLAFLGGCERKTGTPSAPTEKKLAAAREMAAIPPDVQNLFRIDFSPYGDGVAFIQESENKVRVVLNGMPGKFYQSIGMMAVSPDGRRVAYTASDNGTWRIIVDDREEPFTGEIGTPVFSPDSRHVAYEARIESAWWMIIDGNKHQKSEEGFFYHDKFFSSDSRSIIAIESNEQNDRMYRVAVNDLRTRQAGILNVEGRSLSFSKERTMLALVEEKGGKERLATCPLGSLGAVTYSPMYDAIIRYAFSQNGDAVAYVAEREGKRYLVMNGKETQFPKKGAVEVMVARPERSTAAFHMNTPDGSYVGLYADNRWTEEKVYDEIAHLTLNAKADSHVYVARKGKKLSIVVNGREGPVYDMAVSPLVTSDGRLIVYRARKEGKRFVVIARPDGRTIREYPRYDMVFPVVMAEDERSFAYGVKDGDKLLWRVERIEQ